MFDRHHWADCSIFFLRETESEWMWSWVGGLGGIKREEMWGYNTWEKNKRKSLKREYKKIAEKENRAVTKGVSHFYQRLVSALKDLILLKVQHCAFSEEERPRPMLCQSEATMEQQVVICEN